MSDTPETDAHGWRECAERLARDLCDELPKNGTTTALQDFHQLAEASK